MSTLPAEATSLLDAQLPAGWSAEPLAGDASVRAYFRIRSGERSWILAWYPDAVRSQLACFLAAYEAVAPHVPVPRVEARSESAVLQQDVGDYSLYQLLCDDPGRARARYADAVAILSAFQRAQDPGVNRPFSREFFLRELEMAADYFVERLMGGSSEALRPWLERIAQRVADHPMVLCHRDYHGQNVHLTGDKIFVIDYQDLRLGPDTYDLASLLRDRGVATRLGHDGEMELVEGYVADRQGGEPMRRRYFEALLQRSIKILGTFAKLPIERGRFHYLEFIPSALESVSRCIDELPEFAALRDIVPAAFVPAAAEARARELNAAAR